MHFTTTNAVEAGRGATRFVPAALACVALLLLGGFLVLPRRRRAQR